MDACGGFSCCFCCCCHAFLCSSGIGLCDRMRWSGSDFTATGGARCSKIACRLAGFSGRTRGLCWLFLMGGFGLCCLDPFRPFIKLSSSTRVILPSPSASIEIKSSFMSDPGIFTPRRESARTNSLMVRSPVPSSSHSRKILTNEPLRS